MASIMELLLRLPENQGYSIKSPKKERKIIIILESASLETIKKEKKVELLNSEDHLDYFKKNKKDPTLCRPDITHQCLLILLDSPLNKAGLLQVFVHSKTDMLIQINPQTKIPRTFKRFSGLMVQLLCNKEIKSADGKHILMKVIENPVTGYLPVGCKIIGTSYYSDIKKHPRDLVRLPSESYLAIAVGAMEHGELNLDYTEETVSINDYPLSAELTCAKLCTGVEEAWNIGIKIDV